jgi:hypothetical protein
MEAVAVRIGRATTQGERNLMHLLRTHVEKFPTVELQELRDGLLQNGLDSWQAAELISSFLSGRGYGVSRQSARDAVLRFDGIGHSIDCIQAELEKLAMVM